MDEKPHKHPTLILVIGVFFLALLACSEAIQAPVQTAAAAAAQTAYAEAKNAAGTEAVHLWETAQIEGGTKAIELWQTAQIEGGTKAVELWQTAQVEGGTAAYDAIGTLSAEIATQGSNAIGTLDANAIPQFRVPVNGATVRQPPVLYPGPDKYAVDYLMPTEGAFVYPTLPGTIVYSGWDDNYGWVIAVRHQSSTWDSLYYSIYAHLLEGSLTADKTYVDGTEPIGRMGSTGTGAQNPDGSRIILLHFAVRSSDQFQDGTTALYGLVAQTAFDFRPYSH